MHNASQMMTARTPAPPSNQLLSSSQHSEAISIVSPSKYLAAHPHPRASNTSRQSPTTFTDESAHPHVDDSQSQSQSQSQPHSQSNTPTPTQPIYIFPCQSRRRYIDRLAPLGFELPKGHVGPIWQQPLPGQIHHRADEVKNYHLMGTSGWEAFEQRRLAIAQAEIGKIDTAWAANGGGVILDFGVKKRRGRKAASLSTIIEEEEDEKKDGNDERGRG